MTARELPQMSDGTPGRVNPRAKVRAKPRPRKAKPQFKRWAARDGNLYFEGEKLFLAIKKVRAGRIVTVLNKRKVRP